jgi:hypothetical protein
MTKQTKKAVAVATSNVINDWNVDTIITQWVGAAESVRDIFTSIVAHYGVAVVCKAAAGGFNARSVKDKKDDQYKAEASRLGVTVSAIRELHTLQLAIKEKVGTHAWQNAQDTYFGEPEKKAAAPKDEPENIKALKAEKAEHEQTAKVCREEAKSLGEEVKKASGEDKLRLMESQAAARLDAARADMLAKQCATRIKDEAESNAGADAYGTLHAAIKALHDKYATHKDEETARLAKALLTLL